MTHDDDLTPELRRLGLEADDLNGHTVEDLGEYLDAGRTPPDPSIDESPGCQLALQAMERLRSLSASLVQADAEAEEAAARDTGWVARILAAISLDARSGRRVPLSHDDPAADLGITEGAVRGIIRAAEADVEGAIVGRCRFTGDITVPGAPITVSIDASIVWGQNLRAAAEALRAAVIRRLLTHTELNIVAVDVTIHDVHRLPGEEEQS